MSAIHSPAHAANQVRRFESPSTEGRVGDVEIGAQGHEPAALPLLMTKLLPPPASEQMVRRSRLERRLPGPAGTRLIVLAAPAGYGKSTLLASWCRPDEVDTPVAWLTLDKQDNDPTVLWSYVFEAVRRAHPELQIPTAPERIGRVGGIELVLRELANSLCAAGEVTLVLDDFHELTKGPARDSISWFVGHAPANLRLVVATRRDPVLPIPVLRARGQLVELRARDLGFDVAEAEVLLNDRLGLGLEAELVEDLVSRTEGWPAGLYLAALSLRGTDDKRQAVVSFNAANREIVDFLLDEVLEAHEPAKQDLMLRCSVLESLCGRLCDGVLERAGSRELLNELSRENLFLLPLDDRGEWYRLHEVFAQLLRVELEHRHPGMAATLHRRAYVWHRDNGSTAQAIEHAIEAGAFAEAGELIVANWGSDATSWKDEAVLRWIQRLPAEAICEDARLLLVKAWVLSLRGRRDEAAETIAVLEQLDTSGDGRLPDGASSIEASLAVLRAVFPWGDVGAGLRSGLRAAELEGPETPLWPVICWALAVANHYSGGHETAERWYDESVACATTRERWLVAAKALAWKSLMLGDLGRLDEQAVLADQSSRLVQEHGMEAAAGMADLAVGASLAARGRPAEALPLLERGVAAIRGGQPVDLADALLRMTATRGALGEREAGVIALEEAKGIIDSCTDAGILRRQLGTLDASPRPRPRQRTSELSNRERAVLRMLAGPLSERDIGRELYLSHNTIHTHAKSIYRKLSASSRAEALSNARGLGLIP